MLFILFLPCIIFAQLKHFEVTPTASPTQFSLNVDHPDCGQIVVYSSIPGLVFHSNMAGIQETKYYALESKYVIFLHPTRQRILVKSPGFVERELWGPGVPKPKEVVGYYTVEEQNPEPDKVSIFSVTIKVTPPDATLKVDNREYDVSKPVMLKPGTYKLEVSKPGFVTQSKQIEVSAERAFFEVTLRAQELLTVTIRSTPPDADVTLDSVAEGKTNTQVFRYPGNYKLRLSKTGFETIEQNITVKDSGDNTFVYTLQKSTEQLNISLDPPDATLLINNTEHRGNSFELAPGRYRIEARKSGFDDLVQQVEIQKGEDSNISLKLQKSTGQLNISLDPPDATLLINNKEQKGNSFELAQGLYRIEARKSEFDDLVQQVEIQKGKVSNISLKLNRQKGRLMFTVQPIDAEIILSDGTTWTGAKIISLPVGSFTISATLAGYKDKQHNFVIEKDKDTNLSIILEPQSVSPAPTTAKGSVSSGMVFVEGGSFTMGRTKGSGDRNELPKHKVTLDSFYMGKYEVTQSEWQAIMGSNPASRFGVGDDYPVYNVSWYAVLKYCNLRSMAEGLTPVYTISGSTDPANWGNIPTTDNEIWNAVICNWNANGYRMPTEAEWEFAARGTTNKPDYLYSGSNDVNAVAWYDGNNLPSGSKPVGTKAPNSLGLYDMSGNVWEWCWDRYGSYSSSSNSNPTGPASGSYRVIRGGNWYISANVCRVANRYSYYPNFSSDYFGFRLCRAVP